MIDKVEIQIPSLLENVRIVESLIDNKKEKYFINDDIYGNIMIAVTESVTNAIIHGNKLNPKKNVRLGVLLEKRFIKFTIEDEGTGFNYKELPNPLLSENINKPNGRGIFLIKSLCDEIIFKSNGRCLELVFYLKE